MVIYWDTCASLSRLCLIRDTDFEESTVWFDGRTFFVFIWIIWQIVSNGLDKLSTCGESSQSKETITFNIVEHLTDDLDDCKSVSSGVDYLWSISFLTGFMTFRRRENHSWFWITSWNFSFLTAKYWLFSSFWRGMTPNSFSLTVLANLVMWLSRSTPNVFKEDKYTLSSSSSGKPLGNVHQCTE